MTQRGGRRSAEKKARKAGGNERRHEFTIRGKYTRNGGNEDGSCGDKRGNESSGRGGWPQDVEE